MGDSANGTESRSGQIYALIVAAACILYANSFTADFTLDNVLLIQSSPLVTGTEPWIRIFKEDFWWPVNNVGFYRPLTILSFRIQYVLAGNAHSLVSYHALNLALYILTAILLQGLLLDLFRDRRISTAATFLWLAHPLNVECVTNLIGRADLLAGIFILMGLSLYRRVRTRPPGVERLGETMALAAIFFVGTLCKEHVFLLPGAMIIYDLTTGRRNRPPLRSLIELYLPLLVALALNLTIRGVVFQTSDVVSQMAWQDHPLESYSSGETFWTAVKVSGLYLWKFLWPAELSCDYSFRQMTKAAWPPGGPDLAAILGALLAVVGLGCTAWTSRRDDPGMAFCVLFSGLTFLPAFYSNYVAGAMLAERWMFLPMMGLIPIVVCAALKGAERFRAGRGVYVLAGSLFLAYGIRTIDRNRDWQHDIALWTSARTIAPESYKTRAALAYAWSRVWLTDRTFYSSPGSADQLYDLPPYRRTQILYRQTFDRPEHRRASLLDLMISETKSAVQIAPEMTQPKEQLKAFLTAKGNHIPPEEKMR